MIKNFFNDTKYYKNYNEDFISSTQFIKAENGFFKKKRINELCCIYRKINPIDIDKYDKECTDSLCLFEKPYCIKKIPQNLIYTMLKFYQFYAKSNLESKLDIWYDKTINQFILNSPFQYVRTIVVNSFQPDFEYINWTEENIERYKESYNLKQKIKNGNAFLFLRTHSHHNMTESFSNVDDENDYFDFVGNELFAVFRNVIENPTISLRYFLGKEVHKKKSIYTRLDDEILFNLKDIVDFENKTEYNYDINDFIKYVNPDFKEIFTKEYIDKIKK